MSKFSVSTVLVTGLLFSTQSFSYGGIWTDGAGNPMRTSYGDCWTYGQFNGADCGGSMANSEPPVKEVINLSHVTFKTGSDELNDSSNASLDESAGNLRSNPDIKVIVAGHTDNSGDALFNLDLSQKRAETVRNYLINAGVDGSRLIARGYGQTEPVASNDTVEGRQNNRRVELRILE